MPPAAAQPGDPTATANPGAIPPAQAAARGCAITGLGAALPRAVVTNDDLARRLDTSDDWIRERTGIRQRRVATGPFAGIDGVSSLSGGLGTTGSLAVEAGRQALEMAGLEPGHIGLLVLATTTPDQSVPATSAAVAAALGLQCGAMDLNAACAGWVYGLITASSFVAAGVDRVLVIGSETLSRIVDWDDRGTAILFGDGAGAAVVEAVPGEGGLLGWDLGADGALQPLLYCDLGQGIVMDGKEVFRRAVRVVVDSATAALERAKVAIQDVSLFVPHQANQRIIDAAASRLGVPTGRIASVIDKFGNNSSASIPLALADAHHARPLHDGDLVLFSGFGAGMTWASAVWRWGQPAPVTFLS